MKKNGEVKKKYRQRWDKHVSISRTPIVDINMKSSGEVGFLDQVANIRQVFGEKNA